MRLYRYTFLVLVLGLHFVSPCWCQIIDITQKLVRSDGGELSGFEVGAPYKKIIEDNGWRWEEKESFKLHSNSEDLFLTIYDLAGNASALLVHRYLGVHPIIAGGFVFWFGGNGTDMDIVQKSIANSKVFLRVRCVGYPRPLFFGDTVGPTRADSYFDLSFTLNNK